MYFGILINFLVYNVDNKTFDPRIIVFHCIFRIVRHLCRGLNIVIFLISLKITSFQTMYLKYFLHIILYNSFH